MAVMKFCTLVVLAYGLIGALWVLWIILAMLLKAYIKLLNNWTMSLNANGFLAKYKAHEKQIDKILMTQDRQKLEEFKQHWNSLQGRKTQL